MDFEQQKPITDEYREGWARIWSPYDRNIRLINIQIPDAKDAYPNGCPILDEKGN